jgi:hypothetical protein
MISDVQKFFLEIQEKDENLSVGIAAINTLLMVLEQTECKCHNISNNNHLTLLKFVSSFHSAGAPLDPQKR